MYMSSHVEHFGGNTCLCFSIRSLENRKGRGSMARVEGDLDMDDKSLPFLSSASTAGA